MVWQMCNLHGHVAGQWNGLEEIALKFRSDIHFSIVTKYHEVALVIVIAVVIVVDWSCMVKFRAWSLLPAINRSNREPSKIMSNPGDAVASNRIRILDNLTWLFTQLASRLPPLPWQQGPGIVKFGSLPLFQPTDVSSIISSRVDTPTLRICAVRPLRCLSSPGNPALHLRSGHYVLTLRHDLLGHFVFSL